MSIINPDLQEPTFLQPFLSFCHRKQYPGKVDIVRPGDLSDVLFYIVSGSVSVLIEDDDGHEVVLAYLNKGDFFGEMGLFLPQPRRSVLVRTRAACQLAEISYKRLEQLFENGLREHARAILFTIGAQLSQRLVQTSRKVGDLAFLDVTGRVARTLLDLCKQPDAMTHPDGMQIRITRQEIGRIVGCSREMAGRVLKTLEEQGLIAVSGKTIVVHGTR